MNQTPSYTPSDESEVHFEAVLDYFVGFPEDDKDVILWAHDATETMGGARIEPHDGTTLSDLRSDPTFDIVPSRDEVTGDLIFFFIAFDLGKGVVVNVTSEDDIKWISGPSISKDEFIVALMAMMDEEL